MTTKKDLVIIEQAVDDLNEATLARFVTCTRRALRLRGIVSVLVTGSRELKKLNHRFRGKNKPTDMLSFPAMHELTERFAGDVAISAEIAARNAQLLGHTVGDEIKILALHGLLHLAGYDHECDDGKMERRERSLRKSLGLPVGLIERTGNSVSKNGIARKSKLANAHRRAKSPVSLNSRTGSKSRSTRVSR
jgi:probable rRNA maturation factor